MTSNSLLLLLLAAGVIAASAEINCGVNLLYQTDDSLIQSHRLYGRQAYRPSSECRYMIRAWTPNHRIEISALSFDLEYSQDCAADSLTIYDGANQTSRVINQFCGASLWSVLSPGNSLMMVFKTDRYLEKGGFRLRYRFVSEAEYANRATTCPNNFLSCSNGRGCYPKKWKCDGIKDCGDGSDEVFCDSSTLSCAAGQKPCKDNSKCVFEKWWCDGFKDCGDNSDESHCPGGGSSGGGGGSSGGGGGSSGGGGGGSSGGGGGSSSGGGGGGIGSSNCGKPAIQPDESRIVGGKQAIKHSWPWMVSLRLYGGHFCGGSIFNDRWIITAAHCVQSYMSPNLWNVDAGRHCRDCSEPSLQRKKVIKIVKHPGYNPSRTDQDIAMMKLDSPLSFNDKVSTVCLPSTQPNVGANCFATGWGATQGTGDNTRLLQVMVPIISNSLCGSSGYYGGAISKFMVCAGYPGGGRDACQGDSGGPLVCNAGGQWQLQGVTSWGEGCAKAQRPGVYARVFEYRSWIQQTVASN